MKTTRVLSVLLLVALSLPTLAQQSRSFHVAQIAPYDKAVPGQIMQLLVEDIEGGASPLMLPAEDFKLTVSQDGVSQDAKIRTVNAILRSNPYTRSDANVDRPAEARGNQMHAYQSVNFVVPAGLHTGAAELTLTYRGERGNPITLTIVEKPLRPVVGSVAVMTINAGLIPPPGTRMQGNDFGWRLERGQTARLSINPLADPDDPNSAVVVRFKQGDTYYDAQTRVTNEPLRVENRNRGVGFFPARDILEVDVPAALTMGPADVEIHLRANGQDGDAVTLKATIADSARSAEAPALNASRLLMVAPTRIGAGQSMMLSVDYRRTLDPDPSKTVIVIEQGSARYIVPVERSSLKFGPKVADAPVLFFVRTTKQIIGKAQVRIFNQLRGEQTGMSEPVAIEILEDPLPPDLIDLNESTQEELAPLREMSRLQASQGRTFPKYDMHSKFATIRARGVDYNPNFVRITIEQEGHRFTLGPGDFSSYSGELLIVRLPKEIKSGPATLTIQNRAVDAFSAEVSKRFVVCCVY